MAGASGPAAAVPVAIIGGGLAGLYAARLLQSEGVGFRILEDGRKVRVAKATGEVIES